MPIVTKSFSASASGRGLFFEDAADREALNGKDWPPGRLRSSQSLRSALKVASA
jgi:hypothetical protein